jgi:DNA-binding transcriptional LysR family regulator
MAEARGLAEVSPIGWAGNFADIGLARWLRGLCTRPPSVQLTTMQGQINAARFGLGVVALPVIVGEGERDLKTIETPSTFSLDAWLVLPSQTRKHARMRAAAAFVEEAFHACLRCYRDLPM